MALVVIVTAVGMLLSRNAIYSALFLVLNFAQSWPLLYLILGAPFLAMAQMTVYAGAIMVLFLFVIMLLGAERLPGKEPIRCHRVLGDPAGSHLAGGGGGADRLADWRHSRRHGDLAGEAAADYASPDKIGLELFTTYALPFEITSVILLVAVIGASC